MANNLEERGVKALETISNSLQTIEDVFLAIDVDGWSEKIEWYLHEFYTLAKTKVVGNEDRPDKERERTSD